MCEAGVFAQLVEGPVCLSVCLCVCVCVCVCVRDGASECGATASVQP